MPTIWREGGYRFYFFSGDVGEPPHVHVDAGDSTAKFWLSKVALHYNLGFSARELGESSELLPCIKPSFSRRGMRTFEPKAGEKIKAVHVDEDVLTVELVDGRTVSTPLAWYPRLLHATAQQRNNFVISAAGFGIHWPDVDEDLSVQGMLAGAAAPGVNVTA